MHRILLSEPIPAEPGRIIHITGDEAHHAARVKRLETGDTIELLDGLGSRGTAQLAEIVKLGKRDGWALRVKLMDATKIAPLSPAVTVAGAVPKGPRLESMIDELGQTGAAAWRPLRCVRSVVDPRQGKLGRLERVCHETAKQSGRAWAMRIDPALNLSTALMTSACVAADASGEPYEATGHDDITLLVGPEGGWADEELAQIRSAGAKIACFGPYVMRIETAAVVAAGIVLDAERRARTAD